MLLAIDAGNTNTVFAVFDADGTLLNEWRSASDVTRTADEFGIWLLQLMGRGQLEANRVRGAIIASVVPAMTFELGALCRRYFACKPLVVGESSVDLGIRVLLDRPEEVGADRLVNAVAAKDRHGGPAIVIDFGTATTFDVIDVAGDYRGGAIAPGIHLSLKALHMAAAKLPLVAVDKPAQVIGTATVPAMQSGVFWGYVGLIEGLVSRIKAEFGAPMEVVATGGLAPLFAEATPMIDHLDSDLTLYGLYLIHRRNQPKVR